MLSGIILHETIPVTIKKRHEFNDGGGGDVGRDSEYVVHLSNC